MTPEPLPGARRRQAETGRHRPSLLGVLTLLIPLLTIGALALVEPSEPTEPDRTAAEVALDRTTLVCPRALPGSRSITVGNVDGETGEVVVRERGDEDVRDLEDGVLTPQPESPAVVQAAGGPAPGLVALRGGAGRARACTPPTPEKWFTGVGAGAEHASTLVLTNPDGGPAVAEVTVFGPDGVVDVPDLRGVTVPGGRQSRFDLSEVVPSRDELALRVVVTRGRVGVDVEDLFDEVGGGPRSVDWIPGQPAPMTTSYLPGLGESPAERTLTVANPGPDEARVSLLLVSEKSEFEPSGLDELRVAPGSVATLDLSGLLRGRVGRDAVAVRVEATAPVTATIRSLAGGELYHCVAGEPFDGRAALALPRGSKRLVVVGSTSPGVVTWRGLGQDGSRLARGRIEVEPGSASVVTVPGEVRLLDVLVDDTVVIAAVEVGPPGWAVVPMTRLQDAGLVPDVRPALR